MLDLNNQRAVSVDESNYQFNDPNSFHGQKQEDYSQIKQTLSNQQLQDLYRISNQHESHVCIVQKIKSQFEFRNVDFNPSSTVRNFDSSSSFMNDCDNNTTYTAYQYNPKQYYSSSIQRPVCAINPNQQSMKTTSNSNTNPKAIWSNFVTFTDITKPGSTVKEYQAEFPDDGDQTHQDIVNFFYEKVKNISPGTYDDFDAPQYYWHGSKVYMILQMK